MNLYYAVTNYHLLCCILHSIKYHSKEKNVLYLSSWHPDNEALLTQLKKTNIFNRVELFQEVAFPSGNKKVSNNQLKLDIEKILINIPNNFIEDVKKSSEINIAGDHYAASIYLEENKIRYNYLEEACGVLSDEMRLMKIIKNIDYSRYQMMKKLKLPGNHEFINNRYGDLNHQLTGYKNDRDIHFSVAEILSTLSKKQIANIVKVFSDEEIIVPKESTLLLTFHYVNMNLLSLNDQRYLYSILVDYFFKGKELIIKQHPSDIQPNYQEWFPNSIILPRKMPSELLPFLSKSKFSRALTSYSTSIFSLKSYCHDVISFGIYIEKKFQSMHKYYFLIQLLEKCLDKNYKIIGVGLDESIVKNVCYQYHINLDISFVNNFSEIEAEDNRQIIIIDDCVLDENMWNTLGENTSAFWLNDTALYEFLKYHSNDKVSNFSSIFLKKEILNKEKDIVGDLVDELIPYYCCDSDLKKSFLNLKIEKILSTCNMKIILETRLTNRLFEMQEVVRNLKDEIVNLQKELTQVTLDFQTNEKQLQLELNKWKDKFEDVSEKADFYKKSYEEIKNSSSWKITKFYRKVGGVIKKIIRRG